jgi:hypothetical protein
MRAAPLALVFTAAAALVCPTLLACNPVSGEREQLVFLEWNGRTIEQWEVRSPDMQRIELPNGFQLGLTIEPAPLDTYVRIWADGQHASELVKIALFDLGGDTPRRLTSTFGGVNSVQGYGSRGGADGVVELGDPGITLTLLKPVCEPRPGEAEGG